MSSYSFSHQFYQHWTSAPQAVRAAIVQELTDITTLLQTDTPFEEFVFSNHDLDAHLDDLYGAHDKQQAAAKELADKQAAMRAEAEQQRLDEQQIKEERRQAEEKAVAEAERQQRETESIESPVASEEDLAIIDSQTVAKVLEQPVTDISAELDDSLTNKNAVAVNDNVAAINNAKDAINLSAKAMSLNADNEQMIQELEVHIDDYLMEQMMQMSDNLKSWLRAEVTRQLAEKK